MNSLCVVMLVTEGKELEDDVLDSETHALTREQVAAVKKRVDTLNATLHKRHNKTNKKDVRDVFAQPGEVCCYMNMTQGAQY